MPQLECCKKYLTFDDVVLVPQYSEVASRLDPDTSVQLTPSIKLTIPIVSANMDCVTGSKMSLAMKKVGGLGILHRFFASQYWHRTEITRSFRKIVDSVTTGNLTSPTIWDADPPVISIGYNDWGFYFGVIQDFGITTICLDVAHAHTKQAKETILSYKREFPNLEVIAGNVSTSDGAKFLCDLGVSSIKCGTGNGAACSTRIITGCGYPQLSAIFECGKVVRDYDVTLIADGGIKSSADVVKAIAAGAHAVMLGKLLAGADESPAKPYFKESDGNFIPVEKVDDYYKGDLYKEYRGQSSKEFQESHGLYRNTVTPEGESFFIPVSGPVENTINHLVGGLRSGMSYCGASNLTELYDKAKFIQITPHGVVEGFVHGKLT